MSANATPAVYRIADIAKFPTGTQVPAFEGRIVSLKAFHKGTGNGPNGAFDYSFQDLEIEDETGKLVVCLNNRPELGESWKGAYVAFIGGTGKHTGIVSEDHRPKPNERNKNPQSIRRIRVTGAATMEDCDEGQDQSQQRPPQRTAYDAAQEAQGQQPAQQRGQRQQQPQQQAAPRQQAQPQGQAQRAAPQRETPRQDAAAAQRHDQRQQNGGQQRQNGGQQTQQKTGSTKEARVILAKISTLYGLCYDAAVAKAWDIYERHGYAVMPGTVGIMADKLLMESIRRVHVEDLPTSNPAELKGRPLCELLPFLEEALDHNLARRTQVEASALEQARTGVPADKPAATTGAARRDDVPPNASPEQVRQYDQRRQQAPQQQNATAPGTRHTEQHPQDDLTRAYSREEIEAAKRAGEDGAQWDTNTDGDGSAEDTPEWKKGMEDDDIPF